jgi:hypothetical protein
MRAPPPQVPAIPGMSPLGLPDRASPWADSKSRAIAMLPGSYGRYSRCWVMIVGHRNSTAEVAVLKMNANEAYIGVMPAMSEIDTSLQPDERVKALLRRARDDRQDKREAAAARTRAKLSAFRVGQRVTFAGKSGAPVFGIVQTVNTKTVTVRDEADAFAVWRVTPGLLTDATKVAAL